MNRTKRAVPPARGGSFFVVRQVRGVMFVCASTLEMHNQELAGTFKGRF
jgi:hypothetical protein